MISSHMVKTPKASKYVLNLACTERVKNEEVLRKMKTKAMTIIRKRQLTFLEHTIEKKTLEVLKKIAIFVLML